MKALMFKPYFYPVPVIDETLEKIWHRAVKNELQENPEYGKIILVVFSSGQSEILRWSKESEKESSYAIKEWAYIEELV